MTSNHNRQIGKLLHAISQAGPTQDFTSLSKKYPLPDGRLISKTQALKAYQHYAGRPGFPTHSPALLHRLRLKPARTLSGVTPVTVLTKPYLCPGECIFCPSDIRMPKSYLSREPGAQRAATHAFDPYLQLYHRLLAYKAMGHPHQKVELIILGGTWSVYPLSYRRWFIKRCFDALNDFGAGIDACSTCSTQLKTRLPPLPAAGRLKPQFIPPPANETYNQAVSRLYGVAADPGQSASWSELRLSQQRNEAAPVRCVGLVLETRPDFLTETEILCLRRLGATKIQLGLQSLNDYVLKLNRRGHTRNETADAIALLRSYGFKIHAHWMPNLYGSSVSADIRDYRRLFIDPRFRPDELKIYPCSLIPGTDLMVKYHEGEWRPYTRPELLQVLSFCLTHTPRYCRITRMVRDIPSHDIHAGNKLTNFRQIAHQAAQDQGLPLRDIRAREIRGQLVKSIDLKIKTTRFLTGNTTEYFLEFVTPEDNLVAFLRLSLPAPIPGFKPLEELTKSALIREVHVYGQALDLKASAAGPAQHLGLGSRLIRRAQSIARRHGYTDLAVISAVGTRQYYRKLGFSDGLLYQHLPLPPASQTTPA